VPLRKFRRIEDVPPPAPSPTPLAGLVGACSMGRVCAALGPSGVAPRGIRRFRSVEEADAHREEWEAAARHGDRGHR
jgi:hypothetical protein